MSGLTAADVAQRCEHPHRDARGWRAKCPAHDGVSKGSLKIDDDNGKLEVYCHAGCTYDALRAALGLDVGTSRQTNVYDAMFDYHDSDGHVAYQVVRKIGKGFQQRRPDPATPGSWLWNMEGVTRVLYRCPEVVEAVAAQRLVYVVEGEKDVETLRGLGLVATCNVGGAGKWQDSYTDVLRGADVVVLPDNDDAGRKHGEMVQSRLAPAVRYLAVVSLPGLAEHGDVSDWIESGQTAERLVEVVEKAKPIKDERPAPLPPLRTMADFFALSTQKVEWVVEDLMAKGTFTIVAGAPKAGKSVLSRCLIMSVLRGVPFVERDCTSQTVLLYSLEDPENVPGLHFQELGATGDLPLFWRGRLDVTRDRPFLDILAEDIAACDPGLIIIDTIFSALEAEDTNDYVNMQKVLQPLGRIAQSTNTALVALYHTNKSSLGHAISIMGSAAIRGNTDVNIIYHHDEDSGKRYLRSEGRLGVHFESVEVHLSSGQVSLGDAKKVQQFKTVEQAMLDTLEEKATLNQGDWLRLCDTGGKQQKLDAITRLVERGDVSVERGDNNARIYSLPWGF